MWVCVAMTIKIRKYMQTFATAVAKNLPKQERQSKGCVASRYNLEQISNRIISQIKHIETTHNWMRVDKYFRKSHVCGSLMFCFSPFHI